MRPWFLLQINRKHLAPLARLSAPVGLAPWSEVQVENCDLAVQETLLYARSYSKHASHALRWK